jgi:hypothetical protein
VNVYVLLLIIIHKKSNYLPIFILTKWCSFYTVQPNTKITFEPESAVVGSPCIITCDSSGFPAPSHTITHNGTEVSTNKTYTIKVVKWSDAGIYKCVVKNVLGNDSASANLTVTGKIRFLDAFFSPIRKWL